MSVLFIALPVALMLGGAAVIAFVLAARGGQFDDLETPPMRILFDDRQCHSLKGAGNRSQAE
jgi:cbb3-type cytochrome oxidase maturation protein